MVQTGLPRENHKRPRAQVTMQDVNPKKVGLACLCISFLVVLVVFQLDMTSPPELEEATVDWPVSGEKKEQEWDKNEPQDPQIADEHDGESGYISEDDSPEKSTDETSGHGDEDHSTDPKTKQEEVDHSSGDEEQVNHSGDEEDFDHGGQKRGILSKIRSQNRQE